MEEGEKKNGNAGGRKKEMGIGELQKIEEKENKREGIKRE